MQSGKIYRITKRIKLHTKPLYEANVTVIGRYIRESEKWYIFDTFKCWYYETAKKAGTTAVPDNMSDDELPADMSRIRARLRN